MQGGVCACVRRPPRRCQPCLRPPAAAAAPPGAQRSAAGREGAGRGAERAGERRERKGREGRERKRREGKGREGKERSALPVGAPSRSPPGPKRGRWAAALLAPRSPGQPPHAVLSMGEGCARAVPIARPCWSCPPARLRAGSEQPRQPRAQLVPQGRWLLILPLLPRAEEKRDLPGGEQPPLTGSAPSRDAGAFHVLLHQGWTWPVMLGQEAGETWASPEPGTAAPRLPPELPAPQPAQGHLHSSWLLEWGGGK